MDDKQLYQETNKIEQFVSNKIKEYHRRALRNQKETKRGRLFILISSWLATTLLALFALPAPSLDNLGLSPGWLVALKTAPFVLNIAALVSSLIASSLATWMKTGTYEEKWEKYSAIYDDLTNEYFSYENGLEEYDLNDKHARAKLLAKKAKAIWTEGASEIKNKTTLADEPPLAQK